MSALPCIKQITQKYSFLHCWAADVLAILNTGFTGCIRKTVWAYHIQAICSNEVNYVFEAIYRAVWWQIRIAGIVDHCRTGCEIWERHQDWNVKRRRPRCILQTTPEAVIIADILLEVYLDCYKQCMPCSYLGQWVYRTMPDMFSLQLAMDCSVSKHKTWCLLRSVQVIAQLRRNWFHSVDAHAQVAGTIESIRPCTYRRHCISTGR